MELQIGEISREISVDDLRLIKIRDNIRLWNWGDIDVNCIRSQGLRPYSVDGLRVVLISTSK